MTENGIKIPKTIGPYQIEKCLGRGGMGIVYLGKRPDNDILAAVKTVRAVNSKKISGIRREIRALARIQHPCVVRILDEGVESGIPWFAMEFLSGVTLRKFCTEIIWNTSDVVTMRKSEISAARDDGAGDAESEPAGWWTKIFGTTVDSHDIDLLRELARVEVYEKNVESSRNHAVLSESSLKAILTLMVQLSGTLSYLHGEGILHGDLKPDNVLIRPPGVPVIMDFGLTSQLWDEEYREHLEQEGIRGGTVAYLAPELILGELADSRADLYSLGCMLYELVTGRAPFIGDSFSQLIKAHLEIIPIPPVILTEGIPDDLNHLILSLLAKNPHDRMSRAEDVSAALIRLGADPDVLNSLPLSSPHLCRSRFAGREREIQWFHEYLDRIEDGCGEVVLIEGESGIGKTRFLLELSRMARNRKLTVLSGGCSAGVVNDTSSSGSGLPLEVLKKPLLSIVDYCREQGQGETDRIFGKSCKLLSAYLPELMDLPGQIECPEPHNLPVHTAQIRLYTYIAEILDKYSRSKPLLLLLDDLQWADDLTLGFIEFIMRLGRFRRCALLTVCSARPEEANINLQRLLSKQSIHKITLAKLSEREVSSIVSDMLGVQKQPEIFSRFLTQYSEGNPFFISEYLRTAVAEGHLFRSTDGSWLVTSRDSGLAVEADFKELPMPKSVLKLVERRLSALTPDALKVASTASVIGQETPLLILWQLIPFCDDLLDVIDELLKKQVFFETDSGFLCFSHEKIRKVVYENMDESLRIELHESVAHAYESLHEIDDPAIASILAHHWRRAGKLQKARHYSILSARRAAAQYALRDAGSAYKSALELIAPDDELSVQIRNEFVEKVLLIQSRTTDALSHGQIALETAQKKGFTASEARCLRNLAEIYRALGEPLKSIELAEKSLEKYESLNDSEGIFLALNSMAGIRFDLGELDDAKTLYLKSEEISRKIDNAEKRAVVLGNLAPVYFIQGNLERAWELFEEALEISSENKDKLFMAKCLGNLANISKYRGDLFMAQNQYEKALAMFQEIGDRSSEGIMTHNLATVYSSRSDLEKSQELYLRALQIHHEIQNRRMEGITLGNLGSIYRNMGMIPQAMEMFQDALIIHREVKNMRREAEILSRLAELKRLVEKNLVEAEKLLDESERLFQRTGEKLGIGACLIQRSYVELARGCSSKAYWDRLNEILKETQSGQDSQLSKAFKSLQESETAFEKGEPLEGGQTLSSFPEGLRQYLTGKLKPL